MEKSVSKLLNEQINKELYSAYIYLDMSNFYADKGLDGFANWFRVQTMEEKDHAMLILDYLLENGEQCDLLPIGKPEGGYKEIIDPLKAAYDHEKYVTASINAIYKEADKKSDYRTMQFLNWFIKEQGEEEKSADDLVKKAELFGGDMKSLYLLNNELAARVYTPAVIEE